MVMHIARRQTFNAFRFFSTTTSSAPWFVDPDAQVKPTHRPSTAPANAPPVPPDAPETLRRLHAELARVPHLDHEHLIVSRPMNFSLGPPLPLREPLGRRRRRGTYSGESDFDVPNGIWNWIVLAQVKEGTEGRGAIESVLRVVRKTLLEEQPPLPLPPNSKRRMLNEWAMVDAGNFAVHILSKTVRERYFILDQTKNYYQS